MFYTLYIVSKVVLPYARSPCLSRWMFLNLTDSDTPGPGHADSGVWDDWRGTRNSACEDVAGPDNTDYYVDGMWPCMDWNTSSRGVIVYVSSQVKNPS